jgi:DME family drug/metabolite transporter
MATCTKSARETSSGFLFILIAAISWGTIGISTQSLYRLTATNALSIGFFRLAIATPLLAMACWILLRGRMFRIARRNAGLMMLLGAMEALYQVCYFSAIALSGVTIATLITLCTAPVLVALFSTLFIRERPALLTWCALLSAIGGTWLLVNAHVTTPGTSSSLLGPLLALGSALGYAVLLLCARALSGRYHPLQINTVGFGTGAVLLFFCAFVTHLFINYPLSGWLLLGYVGAVPTALAYALFLAGMRSTPATVASILTLLEPLTATILSWILFGERLGPLGMVGACLLLGAILVLALSQRKLQPVE